MAGPSHLLPPSNKYETSRERVVVISYKQMHARTRVYMHTLTINNECGLKLVVHIVSFNIMKFWRIFFALFLTQFLILGFMKFLFTVQQCFIVIPGIIKCLYPIVLFHAVQSVVRNTNRPSARLATSVSVGKKKILRLTRG